jgi:hypothetical protein
LAEIVTAVDPIIVAAPSGIEQVDHVLVQRQVVFLPFPQHVHHLPARGGAHPIPEVHFVFDLLSFFHRGRTNVLKNVFRQIVPADQRLDVAEHFDTLGQKGTD